MVVPDAISKSPPTEFQNIRFQEMDRDKFSRLSSYAKASTENKISAENPQPFIDLFLLLWPGDWKKELQQMNKVIKWDCKKKSKHKHSKGAKNDLKKRQIN
jgi:hypothetical protein